jgi:hypothetical protein
VSLKSVTYRRCWTLFCYVPIYCYHFCSFLFTFFCVSTDIVKPETKIFATFILVNRDHWTAVLWDAELCQTARSCTKQVVPVVLLDSPQVKRSLGRPGAIRPEVLADIVNLLASLVSFYSLSSGSMSPFSQSSSQSSFVFIIPSLTAIRLSFHSFPLS